jgi:hypothetical protein
MVALDKPERYEGCIEQAAPQDAVDYILAQPINTGDGRSHWVWIRLPDDDLVLVTYPQGDTYFSTEQWRTI